jgi:hypothetical protein
MRSKIGLVICCCLFSVQLSAQIPYPVKLPDGSIKEILLLPDYYKTGSEALGLGAVKNKKGVSKRWDEYKTQLDKVLQASVRKGGNIFMLEKISNLKQQELYNLSGKVLKAANYEEYKKKALAARNKKYDGGKCAYLVLYRPVYCNGHNDEVNFNVIVNDTMNLELHGNAKYVIKINHEGPLQLMTGGNEVMKPVKVDVKFGNTYYVRGIVTYPSSSKRLRKVHKISFSGYNPYLLDTDELLGELESSTVTIATYKKEL